MTSLPNIAVAAVLGLLLAIGAMLLHSTVWICGLAAVLSMAGVIMLRGNRWKSAALVAAALAVAVVLLDLLAGLLAPGAIGRHVVRDFEPRDWLVDDAVLGYRPRPGAVVRATGRLGEQVLYRVTYTIAADGTRATPAAPAAADTYLFLGDSFMFGQGLPDAETLPAQFAKERGFEVNTVNFSAPGYAVNHWVRALETGRVKAPAKAVVTWIIPAHLDRVAGEGGWLGSSPRYELAGGVPRHTGTFDEYRWRHPLEGMRHLAAEQFAFIRAIGQAERQRAEDELFVALMLRLQALVRERLGAPMITIYSWPDEKSGPGHDRAVAVLARLRVQGLALLRVDDLTQDYEVARLLIPHDGHPALLTNELIAGELKRRLPSTGN